MRSNLLNLNSGSSLVLLVDDTLQGNSQTANDTVEGASQHGEQAFAVGHGRQALDTCSVHDLTIAEAALDDEALGLVGVSKLAQECEQQQPDPPETER